ncbi:hypothetical protein WJX77_008243 [Trebouxia sp. C0004]
MSKFRQAYAKKTSPLFDGDSNFKKRHHSSFGRFKSAVQNVNSLLPGVDLIFELPTFIVIGGSPVSRRTSPSARHSQDTGMCAPSGPSNFSADASQFFSDDILGQQEGIMQDLDTITDDEIVIKLCQMDVSTIELVDLPGIRMYPPELYQQTTECTRHSCPLRCGCHHSQPRQQRGNQGSARCQQTSQNHLGSHQIRPDP